MTLATFTLSGATPPNVSPRLRHQQHRQQREIEGPLSPVASEQRGSGVYRTSFRVDPQLDSLLDING